MKMTEVIQEIAFVAALTKIREVIVKTECSQYTAVQGSTDISDLRCILLDMTQTGNQFAGVALKKLDTLSEKKQRFS